MARVRHGYKAERWRWLGPWWRDREKAGHLDACFDDLAIDMLGESIGGTPIDEYFELGREAPELFRATLQEAIEDAT